MNPRGPFTALLLLLFLSIASGFGQTKTPDTPAGRTLLAWLEAFNSGDRAKIAAFVEMVSSKQSVDSMMAFRAQTGGFDLLSIDSSEPLVIKFRVKEKASSTVGIGNLQVKDGHPPIVENFNVRAIPPGAVIEDIKLDAAARRHVIDGVILNSMSLRIPRSADRQPLQP